MSFEDNPVIQRHREERKENLAVIAAKAEQVWSLMNKSEKLLVRFGMFPADVIEKAELEMKWAIPKPGTPDPYREERKELTCALMDCASKDGGMRA